MYSGPDLIHTRTHTQHREVRARVIRRGVITAESIREREGERCVGKISARVHALLVRRPFGLPCLEVAGRASERQVRMGYGRRLCELYVNGEERVFFWMREFSYILR